MLETRLYRRLCTVFGRVATAMKKNIPIETVLGQLNGRDCIYLNSISSENDGCTLWLDLTINGNLCSRRQKDKFPPCSIRFSGIAALKMTGEDLSKVDFESSFDEVVNSNWAQLLGYRESVAIRHLILRTYDYIFEILCTTYEFIGPNTID
jgi:hypothetical protein